MTKPTFSFTQGQPRNPALMIRYNTLRRAGAFPIRGNPSNDIYSRQRWSHCLDLDNHLYDHIFDQLGLTVPIFTSINGFDVDCLGFYCNVCRCVSRAWCGECGGISLLLEQVHSSLVRPTRLDLYFSFILDVVSQTMQH